MSGSGPTGGAGPVDLTVALESVGAADRRTVGTKAANLGELAAAGYLVPAGFVVTVDAFGRWQRSGQGAVPDDVALAVRQAYDSLAERAGAVDLSVAVRSSATDEDLPSASFAGVYDSYLDVVGGEAVVARVLDCWSSLNTARAAAYRSDRSGPGGPEMAVLVQAMAPTNRAGVALSDDPLDEGSDRIVIEVVHGRGADVVGGSVVPDRYVVDSANTLMSVEPADPTAGRVLSDREALDVAGVVRSIAELRGGAHDVELALGSDRRIWILQARPLTGAHAAPSELEPNPAREPGEFAPAGEIVLTGVGASSGVAVGRVRVLHHSSEAVDLLDGEVLVAERTDPGWIVAMRLAAAIVTDAGGVTSHAAIVSRELGLPCVVGAGAATVELVDGDVVIVDGGAGTVARVVTG